MQQKIAIQGIKGSYHHEVAAQLFGSDIALAECLSFAALVDQLVTGAVDAAVMALENSIM